MINECKDNESSEPEFDLEKLTDIGEIDSESIKDPDLPKELLRMVEQEEKQILPYKETTELINLGTEEDKKEVKIGTTLSVQERQQLVDLLKKYSDVFAWSYQDMPRLDPEIVVHKLPIKP